MNEPHFMPGIISLFLLFPKAILFSPEESPVYPSNFQNINEYSQYLLLAQNLIHLGFLYAGNW